MIKKVVRRSEVNTKFLENDLKIMRSFNVITKRIERRGKKWISYKTKNLYCD